MLRADKLTLHRGSRAIYSEFSVEIGTGVTAILGANGVGKTTLLESLADPTTIAEGRVELVGQNIRADLFPQKYFAATGFLPQKWSSYRGFTVRDSVSYVAWLKGLKSASNRVAVDRVLAELDLQHLANERVHRLSGGMQQRVGIAEAFVHDPSVVLLDEPTVGLDPEQRHTVRRFLRSQAETRTVIVSTHMTDDVETIADRVLVIGNGTAAFDGTPAELAASGLGADNAATGIEGGYLAIVRRNKEGVR